MKTSIDTVRSADGTPIAYERNGTGNPVILVGGAFNLRSTVGRLTAALAPRFTAVSYDRRGRGDSGDNNVDSGLDRREREFDDLAAVIEAAGGKASVFGHSSGGVLVLEAAASRPDLGIDQLVVYEPAYVIEGTRPIPGSDLLERLQALLREDRRDDAVELYQLEAIGLPAPMVEGQKSSDMWRWLTALAPSLPYDAALYDPGFGPPVDRLATIKQPTLAVSGSKTFESLRAATRAVADAIPHARYVELQGEDHGILHRPEALATLMGDFLS
jgi:pimeloyl-ACP methyl ester carboxylesterase